MKKAATFGVALAGSLGASIAAQASDYDAFALVADALTSAQTCEQLGYDVDREGLAGFSDTAVRQSASSLDRIEEARMHLQREIRAEYDRIARQYARARLLQHAPDNRHRHNRNWRERCEGLAKNPRTAPFFTPPIAS